MFVLSFPWPMPASRQDAESAPQPTLRRPRSVLQMLWPHFIQLWIAAVIAVFFLIRIVGSQTAHRLLSRLLH